MLRKDVIHRKVAHSIKKTLYHFVKRARNSNTINSPEVMKCFYDFIVKSYEINYLNRYSVSMLAKKLRRNGFNDE